MKRAATPIFNDSLEDQTAIKHVYWNVEKAREFYRLFRPGVSIPQTLLSTMNSPEKIAKTYRLRGFQFGHWVNTEDKYNYLAITYICFNDINRVLGFKNNIGLDGKLGISFGARGASAARAHYESKTQIINISRYKRSDKIVKELEAWGQRVPKGYVIPKAERLVQTGGAGSFAHEYGHFLDYTFGRYAEPDKNSNWLTGEYRTTAKKIEVDKAKTLRVLTKNVLDAALLNADGSLSRYSKFLLATNNEYLNRRLEIFARIFEQYISYKLQELKIKNRFLTQLVYQDEYYLNRAELKKVVPEMDKLISELRKLV
jgi:hypothetical protein